MRNKLRFLFVVMAAVMLLTLTACNGIGNPGNGTATETASATTAPPTPTAQPDKTEQPTDASAAPESGYEVGKVMPDFSVPTVDGGTFKLSENLGKPVFINIFATWCGPCVGEMPEIEQLYTELGDQVTFVVIDIGEDKATAQNFADSNGYTLPFAYAADGAPFGADYYVEFIPQTFVLGADGTILKYFGAATNYDKFKAALDAALAQ